MVELRDFLNDILERTEFSVESIENDLEITKTIISYYTEKVNLNEQLADTKSISFLKAGAVIQIIHLEHKRNNEKIDRIKFEYDKQISYLAKELRSTPFLDIKLPECIFEYFANKQIAAEVKCTPSPSILPPNF